MKKNVKENSPKKRWTQEEYDETLKQIFGDRLILNDRHSSNQHQVCTDQYEVTFWPKRKKTKKRTGIVGWLRRLF